MRYRVRTPEGVLEYASLKDLEQAYVTGLVEPGDEVQEEGGSLWRKAESLPALVRAHRSADKGWDRSLLLTIAVSLALGILALYLLWSGAGLMWVLAIAMVVGWVLTRVTVKAFRRPPPR